MQRTWLAFATKGWERGESWSDDWPLYDTERRRTRVIRSARDVSVDDPDAVTPYGVGRICTDRGEALVGVAPQVAEEPLPVRWRGRHGPEKPCGCTVPRPETLLAGPVAGRGEQRRHDIADRCGQTMSGGGRWASRSASVEVPISAGARANRSARQRRDSAATSSRRNMPERRPDKTISPANAFTSSLHHAAVVKSASSSTAQPAARSSSATVSLAGRVGSTRRRPCSCVAHGLRASAHPPTPTYRRHRPHYTVAVVSSGHSHRSFRAAQSCRRFVAGRRRRAEGDTGRLGGAPPRPRRRHLHRPARRVGGVAGGVPRGRCARPRRTGCARSSASRSTVSSRSGPRATPTPRSPPARSRSTRRR